jgi:hypothetical protein
MDMIPIPQVNDWSHSDLIRVIIGCQTELKKRGTITHCFNVDPNRKNCKDKDTIYIEHFTPTTIATFKKIAGNNKKFKKIMELIAPLL